MRLEGPHPAAEERQWFGDIVDASLSVDSRPQFYLWTQGLLQCLVPHEVLVCAVAQDEAFRLDRFGIAPSRLPQDAALAHALSQWERSAKPCVLRSDDAGGPGHAVLHAVRGADARIAAYFCFAGIPAPFSARLAYLIEILVPHVYCTYARVSGRAAASRRPPEVTRREAEVLRWIQEGKTNADIARILHLSPWTVKNHVQNMLKKLGVQNRAQAVSRAIAARLIQP